MEELSGASPVTLTVGPEDEGRRLDEAAAALLEITRSSAVRLIEDGSVLVNGEKKAKNYRLRVSDTVSGEIPEPEDYDVAAEDIPLEIVYEDDCLIVVNKPKGMVVHPAAGIQSGTLVNALLYHCGDSLSGIGGVSRPGIVHRLDKDTSGLIVAAKNDFAHVSLCDQWKETKPLRRYEAVAVGIPRETSGSVDAPIGRHPVDRKKMAIVPGGREAHTDYSLIRSYHPACGENGGSYCHLSLTLRTGRTHQIRVHLASIGHPVLGDAVYGGDKNGFARKNPDLLDGQCLHARTLGFIHPVTGKLMEFTSELPEYFFAVLRKLERMEPTEKDGTDNCRK